jgi:hypothetical protein
MVHKNKVSQQGKSIGGSRSSAGGPNLAQSIARCHCDHEARGSRWAGGTDGWRFELLLAAT